ncbi:MAG: hypothetical protein L0215_10255 [Gemmataceae bacterium]|nr:hypothetical protein [Gemmataceae bacterium]
MGAAIYIVLEKDIPEFDPFVNGKALSASEKWLGALAKKLGVTPLMDFFSADPEEVLDFIEGEEEATGEPVADLPELPAEQWFDAAEGLRTVRILRSHLTANAKELRNAQAVVSDLDEFERVLEKASSQKVRWHLAVDF